MSAATGRPDDGRDERRSGASEAAAAPARGSAAGTTRGGERALRTRHLVGVLLLAAGALVSPFDFWLALIFIAPAFFFLATRLWVAVVVLLLALYLVVTAQRGWWLLTSDGLVAKGLGIALLLLPIVGAWALARELSFGTRIERLGRILEAEGGLPDDDLPRRPSGRVVRSAADEVFEKYRAETLAAPEDWRSWFRLACAYDAAGDRTRARRSMRDAIARYAEDPSGRASTGGPVPGQPAAPDASAGVVEPPAEAQEQPPIQPPIQPPTERPAVERVRPGSGTDETDGTDATSTRRREP